MSGVATTHWHPESHDAEFAGIPETADSRVVIRDRFVRFGTAANAVRLISDANCRSSFAPRWVALFSVAVFFCAAEDQFEHLFFLQDPRSNRNLVADQPSCTRNPDHDLCFAVVEW